MSESIRDLLVEAFGDQGQSMYEAAQMEKSRAAKLGQLQDELQQTRTEFAALIKTAEQRLAEQQATADAAYSTWMRSCALLEQAKISLQQTKAELRHRVQGLLRGMHTPAAPLVEQWQRPSWFRPETDVSAPDNGA